MSPDTDPESALHPVEHLLDDELTDYQREFVGCDADARLFAGGRQSGKTLGAVALAVDWSYIDDENVVVVTPSYDQAHNFIRAFRRQVESTLGLRIIVDKRDRIIFDRGGSVEAVPMSQWPTVRIDPPTHVIVDNADLIRNSRLLQIITDEELEKIAITATPFPSAWIVTGLMYDPEWATVTPSSYDSPVTNTEFLDAHIKTYPATTASFVIHADPTGESTTDVDYKAVWKDYTDVLDEIGAWIESDLPDRDEYEYGFDGYEWCEENGVPTTMFVHAVDYGFDRFDYGVSPMYPWSADYGSDDQDDVDEE